MEPYPLHFSRRPRTEEPMDPNLHLMLDEFQHMDARFLELQCMEERLGEKIDGRCGVLELRVGEVEKHVEERLVSLEMFHMEVEAE
jgi:hypothetical protein